MIRHPNNLAIRDADAIGAPSRRRRCRNRAFTFVELCMGLVVSSMIFAGVAAFSLTTSASWRTQQSTQSGSLRASQIALRLQSEMRGCDAVLCSVPGSLTNAAAAPASVLLWHNDNAAPGAMPDGQIEYSEVELIEFAPPTDSTPGMIYVYRPSGLTTDPAIASSVVTSTACIPNFKTMCTKTPLASHVDGMTFSVVGASSQAVNAVVEFQLRFAGSDRAPDMTRYGTVTLRAPTNIP